MAYEPPSLADLSQTVRSAIRAELPDTDPFVWPNNTYVTAKVFAAALRSLYLRLQWIHRQARVVTADAEALELHGADIGITRDPPSQASGEVTVTATVGTVIPDGSRLLRSDGVVFTTSGGDVTTTAATTRIAVLAEEAGKDGNTAAAATFSFETPISGVTSVVVTSDAITGGDDTENDASLRARILDRKRNPPHGGSPAEYQEWSRQVESVTRVFVKRATPAAGSVTVLFMMDDTYADGIPSGADVATLQAHLESVSPANANIVVKAPTALTVDVEIADLEPDTTAVRDAIETELLAMFVRRAEPGVAGESFTFSRSWIGEAIAIATGEERHSLSSPVSDVVCVENSDGDCEIAVLGTVTYV